MWLTVRGAAVHFTDTGEGTPTLFLHGIPDSGRVWDHLSGLMQASCRCIVPDLPGFGQSAVPSGFTVSLEHMAEWLNDFILAAGLTAPLNLVVHDIGGPYGLAWAVRYPANVKRIVIMNTVFQPEYRWHRYGRICRIPVLGELMQKLTTCAGLARELRASSGAVKPARAHIEATYAGFSAPVRRMVLRMYRGLDPQLFAGWDSELRALTARLPSLVLWGDRDPYIPAALAQRFGAQQLRHFPECGHWPQLEIPQQLAQELQAFFSG